ncbi:MAG TPA: DUF72 domain-containing protein [Longimicrobiales bacterium]
MKLFAVAAHLPAAPRHDVRNYSDWFRRHAGRDARYDHLYEPSELKPWAARAKQAAENAQSTAVDVVFNNHYRGKAVVNALQFRKLIGGSRVPAPPALVEAYAPELRGCVKADAGRAAA